jgi:hypothetical protein
MSTQDEFTPIINKPTIRRLSVFGYGAFFSVLLIGFIFLSSQLGTSEGTSEIFLLLSPLPLIPASVTWVPYLGLNRRQSQVIKILMGFTSALSFLGVIGLSLYWFQMGSPINILGTLFLTLLALAGFWFPILGVFSLANHAAPLGLSLSSILTGMSWLGIISSTLANQYDPEFIQGKLNLLGPNFVLWLISQSVFAIWLGIWLLKKRSDDSTLTD